MPLPYNWYQGLRNDPSQTRREMDADALARNQVQRIPQANRAQDLALQGAEQNIAAGNQGLAQERRMNAQRIAANYFSAIAQSQTPTQAAKAMLSNPNWAAVSRELGLPEFTPDGETDDTIRAKSMDWARALGGSVGGGEGFTLSPGQTRYGAGGTPIASAPAAAEERAPPQGYRRTPSGALEFEPGGPADPANNAMPLRKEFESVDVVKNYRNVLPLYQRATTAPDTMAGDISVIYALGKMFDPTSVVREGELQLSMNAAPWLQKIASMANAQITGEGRLSQETRADIMGALRGQIDAFRAPYEQERSRYSQYAQDSGLAPEKIVGPDPAAAFPQMTSRSGSESRAQYLERLRREVAELERGR